MTTPYPFVAGSVLTAQQLNDIQNLPISDKTASYTLIAGDETKRTIMNNASATTITVNNSIFTVGDVIQVANKGAGTCTITAGAGVTINTSGSLALAQYGGGYLLALSASTFTFFNLGGGVSYGTATGGSSSSITVSSINYTLLTFTTDANLVVSKAGLFDVLMFGGGGGGGSTNDGSVAGAGAGAGAFTQSTVYLDAATYAIDIGAGGSGTAPPTNGLVTSLGTTARSLAAIGGGFGAYYTSPTSFLAGSGGCGGGSTFGATTVGKSLAPTVGGFDGGAGSNLTNIGQGGGGGVTQVGQARSGTSGGAGGAGYDVGAFISGSLFKGGGGGGGSFGVAGGLGGSSVGGNGGNSASGSAAAANTGSGGGGSGPNASGNGGAGGSGIVYVRFKV